MTSFKYTAATLALLLASGLSYAANTTTTTTTEQPAANTTATTTTEQPAAAQNTPECPAAGTVAEADLPAECKNQAATPKQDGTSTTGAAETVQPDANSTATTDANQDNAAGTTTTEIPKQDGTSTTTGAAETTQPDSNAAATTDMPQQGDAATTTTTTGNTSTDTNATATTTEGTTNQGAAAPADVAEAQAGTSVLASQFMGQTVYSTANESVGEINDIVMNRELDNVVAIVGVGGFLGIGEKDVAISIDEITAVKDENNNLRLTIAQTKEQLEAAPTFDRTALK
jgi:sporulation protein YlmC with PRC-barrel domain